MGSFKIAGKGKKQKRVYDIMKKSSDDYFNFKVKMIVWGIPILIIIAGIITILQSQSFMNGAILITVGVIILAPIIYINKILK